MSNKKSRGKRRRRGLTDPCKDLDKYISYEKRNKNLLALGYSSYMVYLSSPEWSVIRSEVLRVYRHCKLCGRRASQVHHLDYSIPTLRGYCKSLLVPLCSGCHLGIEFAGSVKRTLQEANKELFRIAEEVGKGKWLYFVFRSYRWLGMAKKLCKNNPHALVMCTLCKDRIIETGKLACWKCARIQRLEVKQARGLVGKNMFNPTEE